MRGEKKIAFMVWGWRCPYEGCKAKNKISLHFHKARRHGRSHLRKVHGDYKKDPIIIKEKEER